MFEYITFLYLINKLILINQKKVFQNKKEKGKENN